MEKTLSIPSKLLPLWESPARHNGIYGGRGSGKSHGIADFVIARAYDRPTRVLCGREVQKSIKDSVHQLLRDKIEAHDLTGFFNIGREEITAPNGSQFMFKGLRTEDITKVKSIEGVDIAWIEEAQALSTESLRTLIPTIRKEGSFLIYTFNPELDTDPIYERQIAKPPADSLNIEMNWRDNPFFPDVLHAERLDDYERDTTPTKYIYKHIWEGKCLPAVEGAIFADEVATLQQAGRIRPIEYDSSGKVHVIMDLGWGVTVMLFAQRFGSTMQVIGYREFRNKTYDQMTQAVRAAHPDWRWGKVFMPHDAAHRDPKYGKSHKQVMEELEWDVHDIPQIGVANYIERGRKLFQNVYVSDSAECRDLIHCLRRFKYMVTADGRKTTGVDKDEYSHGGEAWCYAAVVAEQMTNQSRVITDPYAGFQGPYAG